MLINYVNKSIKIYKIRIQSPLPHCGFDFVDVTCHTMSGCIAEGAYRNSVGAMSETS
jgi:hypothetical protein